MLTLARARRRTAVRCEAAKSHRLRCGRCPPRSPGSAGLGPPPRLKSQSRLWSVFCGRTAFTLFLLLLLPSTMWRECFGKFEAGRRASPSVALSPAPSPFEIFAQRHRWESRPLQPIPNPSIQVSNPKSLIRAFHSWQASAPLSKYSTQWFACARVSVFCAALLFSFLYCQVPVNADQNKPCEIDHTCDACIVLTHLLGRPCRLCHDLQK